MNTSLSRLPRLMPLAAVPVRRLAAPSSAKRVAPEMRIVDFVVPSAERRAYLLKIMLGSPHLESRPIGDGWKMPGLEHAAPLHPSLIAKDMEISATSGYAVFVPYGLSKFDLLNAYQPAFVVARERHASFASAWAEIQRDPRFGQAFYLDNPLSSLTQSRFVHCRIPPGDKIECTMLGGPLNSWIRMRHPQENHLRFERVELIDGRDYQGTSVYFKAGDDAMVHGYFEIDGVHAPSNATFSGISTVRLSGGPIDGHTISFGAKQVQYGVIEIRKRVEMAGSEQMVVLRYYRGYRGPGNQEAAVFAGFAFIDDALRFDAKGHRKLKLTDGPFRGQSVWASPQSKLLHLNYVCTIRDEEVVGTMVYSLRGEKPQWLRFEIAGDYEKRLADLEGHDCVSLEGGPLAGKALRYLDHAKLPSLMRFRRWLRLDDKRYLVDVYYALQKVGRFGLPTASFVGFCQASDKSPETERPREFLSLRK